jgi:hypothetical protein
MGKDPTRGERGSTGFPAGFDTIIWIEDCKKDEETGVHTIQVWVRKQKDSDDGQRVWLQSQKIDTPNGDSLVLVPVDPEEGQDALSDSKKAKALDTPDVEIALRTLVPDGVTPQPELVAHIMKATGRNEKTIRNTLNLHKKPGGKFHKFIHKDGMWGLPIMERMPQTMEQMMREMEEPDSKRGIFV